MGQNLFLALIFNLLFSQNLWARLHMGNVDAIYKTDDREFVSKKSPAKIQEIARSVGFIVSSDVLEKGLFKTTIAAQSLTSAVGLCADENFAKNMAMPNCTGFLVGKDIMVSAGHCFQSERDCANKKIVFDLDIKKETGIGYSVLNNTVFSCKRIIAASTNLPEDFSIIQLDKAPPGRKALTLNLTKTISEEDSVFMIGHPMGLPQMHSKPASVVENVTDNVFKAELDSFTGNSGSPVINAKTFEVEGILVNGQEDLVFDPENKCYRNKKYENSGGEGVFKSSSLPTFN